MNKTKNTNKKNVSVERNPWLYGGALGSRNAVLLFKSYALGNYTETSIEEKPAYKLHVTYKFLQSETRLLTKLLECHGLQEVPSHSKYFNLIWTDAHLKPGILRSFTPYQRVNRFPRSHELSRKDRLFRNIQRMQQLKGLKNFDIIPLTFIMPLEYKDLCTAHYKTKGPWIVKPVASCRGRGIFIVEQPSHLPLEDPVVVSKYIHNPLLVAGHKCDLRLYVVVTCFDPLLVYIYEEGLVRFATVKYNTNFKHLWNPCMHLCNYSVNKYHSDYVKSDDPLTENVGHKWTLSALLKHLKSEGKDTGLLMSQIEDLIIKAILAGTNSVLTACKMFVPHISNCFELLGFDILIDETMKPWLLEINLSPSLNCGSRLDVRLKSAMVADLLSLVGIPAIDPMLKLSEENINLSQRNLLKIKLPNYKKIHVSHSMNDAVTNKNGTFSTDFNRTTTSLEYTSEENKIIQMAVGQFQRRGGFVRLFPAADSWTKYSQYLDPVTGTPVCGSAASKINTKTNYNLLLFQIFFPNIPPSISYKRSHYTNNSLGRQFDSAGEQTFRQERYERMLNQGYKSKLVPDKILNESRSVELKNQVLDSLTKGKKLSQREARKVFSQYLNCILTKMVSKPDQSSLIEIVLKLLQKMSMNLKASFSITTPANDLDVKDRTAMVAKQLNEFIGLYNRETENIAEFPEKSQQIPKKLYNDFLENARECDLEEILMYQTTLMVPRISKHFKINSRFHKVL